MLADYFRRTAVAAAQVLAGFDEEAFRGRLENVNVGISIDVQTGTSPQGVAIADLAVRLMARLYPTLAVLGPDECVDPLVSLARSINPQIEICDSAEIGIAVGNGAPFERTIFAGCEDWEALLSTRQAQTVGDTSWVFGAGAAACLATAELFRLLFLPEQSETLDGDARFSILEGDARVSSVKDIELPARSVLVGAGAVGQGALWALSRAPLRGRLHVVDMEVVELSNMQRYVLTERADENRPKVDIAAGLDANVDFVSHLDELATFVGREGQLWHVMLLALDSARDRVAAQSSLPGHVINAWTQPGDLGVTAHSRLGGHGACVACLYLPSGPRKNEDELVAETLGVPQLQHQVRTLLATAQPVDRAFLMAVSEAAGLRQADVLQFEGRSVRELYVEGFCGGGLVPLSGIGRPQDGAQEIHVPLAHQSALAGVLLAAALVDFVISGVPEITQAIRTDVLKPPGLQTRQLLRAARDGRCLCDDPDFVEAHTQKYGLVPLTPEVVQAATPPMH